MSPDEWSKDRLDDLAQQVRVVAALTTLVATHDAKLDALEDQVKAGDRRHDTDMAAVERIRDQNIARFERMFKEWSVECNKKIARIEDRLEKERAANEWTLSAKLTLFAAVFGPLLAALIVVVFRAG